MECCCLPLQFKSTSSTLKSRVFIRCCPEYPWIPISILPSYQQNNPTMLFSTSTPTHKCLALSFHFKSGNTQHQLHPHHECGNSTTTNITNRWGEANQHRVTSPRMLQVVCGANKRVQKTHNGGWVYGVTKVPFQLQASIFPLHLRGHLWLLHWGRVGEVAHILWPCSVSETLHSWECSSIA